MSEYYENEEYGEGYDDSQPQGGDSEDERQDDQANWSGAGSSSGSGSRGGTSAQARGGRRPLPTLRGAPQHMRSQIIRTQNAEYQRRTRERRRAAYLELVQRHRTQIEQISALEQRVAELVRILEDAGLTVPPTAADAVCESMTGDSALPDGERLYYELESHLEMDADE